MQSLEYPFNLVVGDNVQVEVKDAVSFVGIILAVGACNFQSTV
jgi:hypothetical protein